jgi:CRP-like cAMP-binding protein
MRPFTTRRPPLADVAPFDRYRYRHRALAPLVAGSARMTLPAGTTLARPGRAAREAVVVVSGEVLVMTDAGVERRGAGAWIGARELLAGERHAAAVVAGDDVDVVVLTPPALRCAARELPGLLDAPAT